jgi:two-component system, LytTR family, sensor kinase
VLSLVSTVAAIRFYVRARRHPGVSLEALFQLLKASPIFREGLSQEAADRIVTPLYQALGCVAVGLTDEEGTLLNWDGGAGHHYPDLLDEIGSALRHQRKTFVSHESLPCPRRGGCGMRTAMIVPLPAGGETQGVLIVLGRHGGRRLTTAVEAMAEFISNQLELARLEETKTALLSAEVRALRAQISPHFIYNALNTISELIRREPETAEELLQDFADFTRYSFRTSSRYTTLAEELRNIDRYLTIEAAVHGGKIGVRMKIAPEVLPVVLPSLILQPLVENAIKHGLSGKRSGGTVMITAQDLGSEAVVSVEDDGVGMDPELLDTVRDGHEAGLHIGLGNINQRMQNTFGREYALVVETAPDMGTKVTLRLPKFHQGVRPDYQLSQDLPDLDR